MNKAYKSKILPLRERTYESIKKEIKPTGY